MSLENLCKLVEEGDAEIEAAFKERLRVRLVQNPGFPLAGTDGHRAKTQFADLQTGPTKRNSFHGSYLQQNPA